MKSTRTGEQTRTAYRLGKTRDYFSFQKYSNPEKWKYINSLHDDLFTAFKKYEDEMRSVKSQVSSIWYELEESHGIYRFSKFIFDNGYYTCDKTFISTAPRILFNSIDGFGRHSTFVKYKGILNLYKKYKEKV